MNAALIDQPINYTLNDDGMITPRPRGDRPRLRNADMIGPYKVTKMCDWCRHVL